jgi:hypothetical protein
MEHPRWISEKTVTCSNINLVSQDEEPSVANSQNFAPAKNRHQISLQKILGVSQEALDFWVKNYYEEIVENLQVMQKSSAEDFSEIYYQNLLQETNFDQEKILGEVQSRHESDLEEFASRYYENLGNLLKERSEKSVGRDFSEIVSVAKAESLKSISET